jgi:hypothetical protein
LKKKDLRISLITHDLGLTMTPSIPFFDPFAGPDQCTGSDPLISSRRLQAHDLKSGGSPSGEAQLPNQQHGRFDHEKLRAHCAPLRLRNS